jgi:hypothetical protein
MRIVAKNVSYPLAPCFTMNTLLMAASFCPPGLAITMATSVLLGYNAYSPLNSFNPLRSGVDVDEVESRGGAGVVVGTLWIVPEFKYELGTVKRGECCGTADVVTGSEERREITCESGTMGGGME